MKQGGRAGDGGGVGQDGIPSLRDDYIEERFVGLAKAGEADLEDHCLSTSLLQRKSLDCQWEGKILVGLRLHPRNTLGLA